MKQRWLRSGLEVGKKYKIYKYKITSFKVPKMKIPQPEINFVPLLAKITKVELNGNFILNVVQP